MRGFLKEAFSLIAYAAAFIGAIWWGPVVYPWVMQYVNNALISMGIGYAVVFIAMLLVVGLVNVTLATLIEATGLGPADQGLGILFGIARGVMIILILVVLAGYTPFPKEPWWVNARFSPMAMMAVHEIKLRLPDSIGSYLPY